MPSSPIIPYQNPQNSPDNNHKKTRQDLGKAENNIREHWPELRERTRRKQVGNCFLEVVEYDSAVLNGFDNCREGFEKNHVGGFDGNVGAGTEGYANVCCFQGGSVVYTVAGHADDFVTTLEFADDAELQKSVSKLTSFERVWGIYLLLRSRASENNLIIFAKLFPLILVKRNKLWSAQHD